MKNLLLVLLLTISAACCCTANDRAKRFRSKQTITLPCGKKLLFATWKWKEGNLWYATRAFSTGEIPETVTLQEDSRYGVLKKGTITFVECSE